MCEGSYIHSTLFCLFSLKGNTIVHNAGCLELTDAQLELLQMH